MNSISDRLPDPIPKMGYWVEPVPIAAWKKSFGNQPKATTTERQAVTEKLEQQVKDSQAVAPWEGWLPVVKDTKEIARQMVADILRSETLNEVLAVNETVAFEDLEGHVVTVRGCHLQESDQEDGLGVYAVIDAQDHSTGEDIVVTAGGAKVVAQLTKFAMLNAYPIEVRCMLVASRSNPSRKVHQFASVDAF